MEAETTIATMDMMLSNHLKTCFGSQKKVSKNPTNKGFGVWGLGFGVWGLGRSEERRVGKECW